MIFQFKLNGTAQEALDQIKDKEYAQKYELSGKEIIKVGVNFSTKTRQVSQWKVTDAAGTQIAGSEQKGEEEPEDKATQPPQVQGNRQRALLEQAQTIARHLLAQGLGAELVAQSTGLPIEEVLAL